MIMYIVLSSAYLYRELSDMK